uniref:U3 small nucleolar RNA-associated protein 13 C-terminal domain-containing protein n=1 Tax=Photinus pyralis TaxID=7054 RepID=A0A1Y1ME27_PHOPY
MISNVKMKEEFDVESKHGAFYTGGNLEWHHNLLFCQNKSSVSLLDIDKGVVVLEVGEKYSEASDLVQTFTADRDQVVTSHKSGSIKLWKHDGALVKTWKSIHKGPIVRLVLNGSLLASGGSDGNVRIWNMENQMCVLGLKGLFGIVNVVEFHSGRELVFASGDDGKIATWCLKTGTSMVTYNGHFSKVTAITFHEDTQHFVSCGRDRVIMLWTVGVATAVRVVPTYETLEDIVFLPNVLRITAKGGVDSEGMHVATVGSNGLVRIWDMGKSAEIFVQTNSLVSKAKEDGRLAIQKLLFDKERDMFAVVAADQTIVLHELTTFNVVKQFVGFSDEILDVVFVGKNDSHIAVATNSEDIKLYESATMNCNLLKGHTDLVLALSASKVNCNLLLSSAKDNTIRLWRLFEKGICECVGIGMAHTGSVDSIAFSNLTATFAISASQDTCLKVWELPSKFEKNSNLLCKCTEVAHQKGINSVAVSPNDKIIATGSQDKTAKLWTDSLELIGVLHGHKRGIWCVRFSPVDQIVLTSSTDGAIKLWSITTLNCLKTFEGHDASVHRAEFISNGMQILSGGADGLIKLFNIKTAECVNTFDQHEARVWTLAINQNETGFITGGADSFLIKWKDVTEDRLREKANDANKRILQEQQINNYLQNDELLKALTLALNLARPFQTLKIVQLIIKKGDYGLTDTIHQLRNDQKDALLKCVTDWNTNSHNCHSAQLVLNILMKEMQTGHFWPVGLNNAVEEILPYTDRHFKRLSKLMQDLHFINYTINCMQPHAKNK